jgi:hypothetical protein
VDQEGEVGRVLAVQGQVGAHALEERSDLGEEVWGLEQWG